MPNDEIIESESVANTPTQVKKSSNAGSWIAMMFALLALAGTAFTWHQTQVVQTQKDNDVVIGLTSIQGEVARIEDAARRLQLQQDKLVSIETMQRELQQQEGRTADGFSQMEEQQEALREQVNSMRTDLNKGVTAYLVEEALQLMRLANQSLALAGDKGAAINALELAKKRLEGIEDPRFIEVRQQIDQDLVKLEQVKSGNMENSLSRLQRLAILTPDLVLAHEPVATEIPVTPTAENELSGFEELVRDVKAWLRKAFHLQRVEQGAVPLLPPEQQYFLRQNLILQLNSAELALVSRKQNIYYASIEQARSWLNAHFDANVASTKEFDQELQSLLKMEEDADLPVLSETYLKLQALKGE